jgi:hypothetical protein
MGDGLSAELLDLLDHGVGGIGIRALAVAARAQIADYDPRTVARELQRFDPPETMRRPGDDRHPALQHRLRRRR